MARWVRRRDRAGRVLVIANQKPGVLDRYGISREEADRAAWTIDRGGKRLGGAAAVNRALGVLGGPWRVVGAAYRLPVVGGAEEAFYRWFASRRSRFKRFGVTPECDDPSTGCA